MLRLHIPKDCEEINIVPSDEIIISDSNDSTEIKPIAYVSSTDENFQLHKLDFAKRIVEFKVKTNLNFSVSPFPRNFFVLTNEDSKKTIVSIQSSRCYDLQIETAEKPKETEIKKINSDIPLTTIDFAGQTFESRLIAENADCEITQNPDEIVVLHASDKEAFLYNLRTNLAKKSLCYGKNCLYLADGRTINSMGWWLRMYNPAANTIEMFINTDCLDLNFATMIGSDEVACRGTSECNTLFIFNTSDFKQPIKQNLMKYVIMHLTALGNNHLVVGGNNGEVELFERFGYSFMKTQTLSDELSQLKMAKINSSTKSSPQLTTVGTKSDTLVIVDNDFIKSTGLVTCWRMNDAGKLHNISSTAHQMRTGEICKLGNTDQFLLMGHVTRPLAFVVSLWNTELQSSFGNYTFRSSDLKILPDGRCILIKDKNLHLLQTSPFTMDSLQKYIDDSVPPALVRAGKNKGGGGLTGIILSYLFCPAKKSEEDKTAVNVISKQKRGMP